MFVVRPVVQHFIWWALLAPLLLLELRALHNLQETLALQDSSRSRRVTASIVDHKDNGARPVVRYEFQVPNDQTRYSAADTFGRRNLWMAVSDETLAKALASNRKLDVVYLADKPWINMPIGHTGNAVVDGFAGWLLFLIVDLLWLGETAMIAINFRRCLLAAERQQPYKVRFWQSLRVQNVPAYH